MNDRIIAFLRENAGGVGSRQIAEQFLKFKAPDEKLAHRMVSAVLGADRRAVYGDDKLWRASKAAAAEGDPRLRDMPWTAVSVMAKGKRLVHVSVWNILPEPSHQYSAWFCDPAELMPEEQETLCSPLDSAYAADRHDEMLAQIAEGLRERVPLFVSSAEEGLLAWQCGSTGAGLGDNGIPLSRLFRACAIDIPKPFSPASAARAVTGRLSMEPSAAGRGKVLAECARELLVLLEQAGVETLGALDDRLAVEIAAFDFSGKTFTAETLSSLSTGPGVYGFTDSAGAYIYVGKAANLKRRVGGYFGRTEESPEKLDRLRGESIGLTVHPCGSELESLILEQRLIRKHAPRLNSQVEINERKGSYRPIDDCVVLLPHAGEGKGMSVWFRRGQKIQLKPFAADFSDTDALAGQLEEFFFSSRLDPSPTDFPEQEIAQRWLSRRLDLLPVVMVSRMASGTEVLSAMKMMWMER